MAENLIDEDAEIAKLRNEPIVEVTNNTTQVTNTDTPTDPVDPKVNVDPNTDPVDPAPVEKPYYETKGFASQMELDAFIENNKTPKKAEYKTDFSREFDAFAEATGKQDLNAFQFYKNTEIKDNMEPKDYVKMIVEKEILDNPELARFREFRTKELETEYMLDMPDDKEGITEEDQYQKMRKATLLKKEAESVINDIKTTREKMANAGLTEAQIKENEAKLASNKTAWNEWTDKTTKEFKIPVFDEKKNDKGEFELAKNSKGELVVSENITLDPEMQEFFKTGLDGVITQMGFPDTHSDSANVALDVAEAATIKRFLPRIIKNVKAQTRSEVMKEFNIDADNPSVLKAAEVLENKEGILDEETAIKNARSQG